MLINQVWTNVLSSCHRCFLAPQILLASPSTFSVINLMSYLRSTTRTQRDHQNNIPSKAVQDPCCSRSLFPNFKNNSTKISTSIFNENEALKYLGPKYVSDKNPICNKTLRFKLNHFSQRDDKLRHQLKGLRRNKKVLRCFLKLGKTNLTKNTFTTSKKAFSTSAVRHTSYKIGNNKKQLHKRGAPLTPSEQITKRDEEFYDQRKKLEGVYCVPDKTKLVNPYPKCAMVKHPLENCARKFRDNCLLGVKSFPCRKVECPYPCYAECKDPDPEPPFSECLLCPIARADHRAEKMGKNKNFA